MSERSGMSLGRWLMRLVAWGVVVMALAAGVTLVLLDNKHFRAAVFPARIAPEMPHAASFTLRNVVLDARDAAGASGDLLSVARTHAVLSEEALRRAKSTFDSWMGMRHAESKLFPESWLEAEWNYRNTAADFFCFQFHVAAYLGLDELSLMRETIEAERAISGPDSLAHAASSETGRVLLASSEHPIFGARGPIFGTSEYAKDGLLSLYEGTGDEQVRGRLVEVMDVILASSQHESRYGLIPSSNSEVNGEVLQVLGRMSLVVDRPAYAEMQARLTDAIVGQMMVKTGGLPVHSYDFEADEVEEGLLSLRDHGNEIIAGLTESYALAVARRDEPVWAERAGRWAEPIGRMLELVLEHGRDERGLIVNEIDPVTYAITDLKPSDNWGYVLNGVLLFADAAERHGVIAEDRLMAMRDEVMAVAEAVAATDGFRWQGASMDGYADAIESALYLSAYYPRTAGVLLPWVDRQIGIMFDMQAADGFVSQGYLDGNYMRTSLMYAELRSGGWKMQPWEPGTRVGLAEKGGRVVIVVESDGGYEGRLVRGRSSQPISEALPWRWARLNSWPAWNPLDDVVSVEVIEGDVGGVTVDGLAEGLAISLPAGGRLVLGMVRE
ncbi:MAG: hypothetical protein RLN76_06095 [Phycisphaeraceae bacterium]